jgi:predicted membrane protein
MKTLFMLDFTSIIIALIVCTTIIWVVLGVVSRYFAYRKEQIKSQKEEAEAKAIQAEKESKRKVIEEYRNRYLNALKVTTSIEEMKKINAEEFQKYIEALKALSEQKE